MAFLEAPRFPETVSSHEGWSGGPGYRTDVIVVESGREQRGAIWAQARHTYDAAQAARYAEQYAPLQDFFHIAGGMANGFRVKDFLDYSCVAPRGILIHISGNNWQLYKQYIAGASTRNRVITKPTADVVVVGGTATTGLDLSTGIWAGTGTPASWTGTFDVPCRFGVDEMHGRIVDQSPQGSPIIVWDSIPILEIKNW